MEASGRGTRPPAPSSGARASPSTSPLRFPRVVLPSARRRPPTTDGRPLTAAAALAARLAEAAGETPPQAAAGVARKRRRLGGPPPPPPPPPGRRHLRPAQATPAAELAAYLDDDEEENRDNEGGRGSGRFRFFYDEQRFRGRTGGGDDDDDAGCVVCSALSRLGGVRTGGHPKASPVPGPLGYSRPGEWDLLWSPARTALRAAEERRLRPGQVASALPGMACLTKKRRLGASLAQAYGHRDAWSLVSPLTFELPLGLSAWRGYLDGEGEDDEEERQGVIAEQGEGREERQEKEEQRQRERKRRRQGELWILKTAEHLGKGLTLLPAEQAYEVAAAQQRQLARRAAAARQRAAATQQQGSTGSNGALLPPDASSSSVLPLPSTNQRSFLLAQRYVSDPLLLPASLPGGVGGRKFGLRLWMVVTGVDPLRAYVFKRGLVLFSDAPYCSAAAAADGDDDDEDKRAVAVAIIAAAASAPALARPPPPPPPPRAHVTNYAANVDGDVWDLAQLERALGADAFAQVWRRCLRSCALAAAAACADLRAERRRLNPPAESGFELVGLDFVVDSEHRPWLLEVNSTPSLSAEHSDPATRRAIRQTKGALVEGLLASLLGAPQRFDARYAPLRAWVAAKTRAAKGGGTAARTAELERAAARLEPAAAAASRALVSSGGGGGAGGERAGDGGGAAADAEQRAASVAAALAELDRAEQAGDFEPLFDLFPYDEVFERGWDVPFGRADYELRDARRQRPRRRSAPAAAVWTAP